MGIDGDAIDFFQFLFCVLVLLPWTVFVCVRVGVYAYYRGRDKYLFDRIRNTKGTGYGPRKTED